MENEQVPVLPERRLSADDPCDGIVKFVNEILPIDFPAIGDAESPVRLVARAERAMASFGYLASFRMSKAGVDIEYTRPHVKVKNCLGCPFYVVDDVFPSKCRVNPTLLSEALGRPVRPDRCPLHCAHVPVFADDGEEPERKGVIDAKDPIAKYLFAVKDRKKLRCFSIDWETRIAVCYVRQDGLLVFPLETKEKVFDGILYRDSMPGHFKALLPSWAEPATQEQLDGMVFDE